MRSLGLVLERFDAFDRRTNRDGAEDISGESVLIQRARAEAYSEGYAAGQAVATATADEQEQLLVETCKALEAALTEIPDRLNRQTGKAFKIILEKIFPALASSHFAEEAAAVFSRIQIVTEIDEIKIAAPLDKVDALKATLEELAASEKFNVTADPALKGAVAKASWQGGGTEFNMDQAISDCVKALETVFEITGSREES